jgi:hypothetical protein
MGALCSIVCSSAYVRFLLYESVRVTDGERQRQRQTKSFFCTKWVVIESDEDRYVGGWVFLSCVFCRVPDLGFFLLSNGHAAMGIIGKCGMSFV